MDPYISINYPTETTVILPATQCEISSKVFVPQHDVVAAVRVNVDGLDGGVFALPPAQGVSNYTFTVPPLPIGQHSVLLSLLIQETEAASHAVTFTVAEPTDAPKPEAERPPSQALPASMPAQAAPAASVRILSPPSCASLDTGDFTVEIEAAFPATVGGVGGGGARLILVINGHERPLEPAARAAVRVATAAGSGPASPCGPATRSCPCPPSPLSGFPGGARCSGGGSG